MKPAFSGRFFFFPKPGSVSSPAVVSDSERMAKGDSATGQHWIPASPFAAIGKMSEEKKAAPESKPESQPSVRKAVKGGGYTIPVQMF